MRWSERGCLNEGLSERDYLKETVSPLSDRVHFWGRLERCVIAANEKPVFAPRGLYAADCVLQTVY